MRLRQNKVADARQFFEQAVDIDANHNRALTLLGLSLFRLDDFDSALPLYERLVINNSDDPAYRMNLGLVHLKLGNADGAIDSLRAAKRIDPSQKRISQYLGLAHARAGNYSDAYRCFLEAGKSELASEMSQHLDQQKISQIHAAMGMGEESSDIPIIESQTTDPGHRVPESAPEFDVGPVTQAVQIAVPQGQSEFVPLRETTNPTQPKFEERKQTDRGYNPPPSPSDGLASFTASRQRAFGGDNPTFSITGKELVVNLTSTMLMRNTGVIATSGHLEYAPTPRVVRGQAVDTFLGGEAEPVFTIRGVGWMLVDFSPWHLYPVDMNKDELFVLEQNLHGIESSLGWDCGNIPGGQDAVVLHCHGTGTLALRAKGEIDAVRVSSEAPLYCDLEHFVAWTGKVFPKVVAPHGVVSSGTSFVECSGDGYVYLSRRT